MCLDECVGECVGDSGKLKQCHVVTLPAGCVLVASYSSLPIKAVLCSAADCVVQKQPKFSFLFLIVLFSVVLLLTLRHH